MTPDAGINLQSPQSDSAHWTLSPLIPIRVKTPQSEYHICENFDILNKSCSNQKPKKDTLCMGVARALAGKKRRPVLVSQ